MTDQGWIGVDFDGTLAGYDSGQFPALGEPIPAMVARVKGWLADGVEVRIFTARVSVIQGARGDGGTGSTEAFVAEQRAAIEAWCVEHLGQALPVTCVKDFQMVQLWDDRCVQVQSNTGVVVQEELERLQRRVAELEAGLLDIGQLAADPGLGLEP